jgi:hypothetical protein
MNKMGSLLSGSLSLDCQESIEKSWFSADCSWGGFEFVVALPDDLAGRAWP